MAVARLNGVSLLIAVCMVGCQGTWTSTDLWKAYQGKLQAAYSLEVKWTVATSQDPKETYRLVRFGPDRILLEIGSRKRVIWNRDRGLELDLAAREYKFVDAKPAFEEASFLRIPGVLRGDVPDHAWPYRRVSERFAGAEWTGLEVTQDVGDHGAITTYWFNPKTGLVAQFEHRESPTPRRVVRTVGSFDLYALPSPSEFALDPPGGFKVHEEPRTVHREDEAVIQEAMRWILAGGPGGFYEWTQGDYVVLRATWGADGKRPDFDKRLDEFITLHPLGEKLVGKLMKVKQSLGVEESGLPGDPMPLEAMRLDERVVLTKTVFDSRWKVAANGKGVPGTIRAMVTISPPGYSKDGRHAYLPMSPFIGFGHGSRSSIHGLYLSKGEDDRWKAGFTIPYIVD